MEPLELVKLPKLMDRTRGKPDIVIGLIDGPVATNHTDLSDSNIREVSGATNGMCAKPDSTACAHGTFVAGILSAKRGSSAPAICPDCTLLVRPIFSESADNDIQSATPEELAQAIYDCIQAGARILNISAAIVQPGVKQERILEETLERAANRGVIVVAAAGNQGTLGSTAITRHPWVLPVVAYDQQGRPMDHSNLGNSIGRHGLGAPGDGITSLGPQGQSRTLGGTSAAAPFVTGTAGLLWSEFPTASAAEVKLALARSQRRTTVVPPLLNAWAAYRALSG